MRDGVRKLKFLAFDLILIGIFLTGCEENDPIPARNIGVENFVELLRINQYDSLNIPAFTPEDIPALLQYRNDKQIITVFPRNPISSFYGADCRVGIYILWTIESIRAVSINSERLILRFPSQNPILAFRNSGELQLVYDDKSHTAASDAYKKWWCDNKNKGFEYFKNIDPLASTDYKWH